MANYRDGYFDRGAPAGGVIGTAILVADGQAVSLDGISQLQITSEIACEKTGRRCFGMELEPKYCDVIIKRWEQFTGRTAILSAQGETVDA